MGTSCTALAELRRVRHAGYVLLDGQGQAVECNARALELFGARHPPPTPSPADLAALQAALARVPLPSSAAMGGAPLIDHPASLELPDGTWSRLRLTAFPMRCDCAAGHHRLLIVSDTGVEAQVLDELWEYRRYFSVNADLMCIVRGDDVVHVNEAVQRVLGLSPEQFRGRPQVHPDDRAALETAVRGSVAVKGLLLRHRHADSSWRTLSWNGARDVSPSFGPCWYLHGTDVTARRAKDQDLERSRLELAEAHQMARLGRCEINLHAQSVGLSLELAQMLGDARGLAMDFGSFVDRVHAEDTARLREALARVLKGEEAVAQLRFSRAGQSPLDTRLWLRPRPETDGQVRQVIGVAQDVSEQAHLTAKLQLAERLASMGTLAAGIAHEINNPLAFVIANLNAVRNELAEAPLMEGVDLEDVRDALKEAADGAERVRQIVSDLKTFTRTNERQRGPIDVRRVLQAALNMARNETKHRAQVVTDLGEVSAVNGNEARLGQVFLNLLVNAAQAIPDGRAQQNRITVATRMEGQTVVATIEDTGCGIRPEVLPRIFDPYFSTKRVGEGTGLGLFISLGIIKELGGDLQVHSTPGKGTTFEVRLPSAPPQPYSSRPTPVPLTPRSRILVVDDEPNILRAMDRLLGREHEVTCAQSGHDAIALVDAGHEYDIIFCDVMMPDLSGMDVWEHLDDRLRRRVVFMTGGTFSERASEFMERVKPQVLDKPVTLTTLLKVIARRAPGSLAEPPEPMRP